MADEDNVSVVEHEHLDPNPDPENVLPGGTDLNFGDQEREVQFSDALAQGVRDAIAQERKFYSDMASASRPSTNTSGDIVVARFTLYPNAEPMMICREKIYRGLTKLLVVTTNEVVYFGKHRGINPGGLDVNTALTSLVREVRYRGALWAVVASTAPATGVTIEVLEEFD